MSQSQTTWPAPYYPSLSAQLMPERMLDGLIQATGVNLGWMQSHVCACTYGYSIPGSPDPNCNTCNGRGFFWNPWDTSTKFRGLITFMHTATAPDEPGVEMDSKTGQYFKAEPTLTIPYSQQNVWLTASEMDAYVELDATSRYSSVLVTGQNTILPYQQNLQVLDVYTYNPATQMTTLAASGTYVVSGATVTIPGSPDGTAYTVEYMAAPVYIAWRSAGGLAHSRPFAGGTGQIPKRFRLVTLDVWLRGRNNGAAMNILQTSSGVPIDTSANGPAVTTGPGGGASPNTLT